MASLLNNASLLLNPAGSIIAYEEDKILSVLPSNGTGDFTFSGGDGGTRVNQQGYIEVTPANLLSYSNTFSNGIWNQENVTPTYSQNDPFGTNNATLLLETTANGQHRIYYLFLNAVNNVVTQTIYVKSAGRNQILFGAESNNFYFIFDFTTGTISSPTNYTSYSAEFVGDGWWRLKGTWTNGQNLNCLFVQGYNGGAGYVGDVTKGFYIYGGQLNIGSTAKPYQPTTDRLNYPRITYQNGRGALLSEPQRTNLITYSQQFDNGVWEKPVATVTINTITSPDGTQNADTITCNGTGYQFVRQSIFGATNQSCACSVYVKQGNARYFAFRNSGNTSAHDVFDFNSSSWVTNNTGATLSYEVLNNGWFRLMSVNSNVNNSYWSCFPTDSTSGVESTTSSNLTVYVWGAQGEQNASFASTYIPTTSATVTRPVDIASKTGASSLINASEGVLYFDGFPETRGNYEWVWFVSNGSNNLIGITFGVNLIYGEVYNGSYQALLTYTSTDSGRYKIALAYKANDFAMYVNGQLAGTDTSGAVPTGLSYIDVGYLNSGGRTLSQRTNTAALFNTRLTNTELATLTTVRSGSGGNISYYGPYTIHTFTGSATFTPSFTGPVEVLVVAGGGGGGARHGGGGGAGGLIYASSYGVSAGTGITVTVGAGGPGVNNGGVGDCGINGSNSVFGGLTAIGGGGGGSYTNPVPTGGASGGGGGGGLNTSPGGNIPGQGNPGGTGGAGTGGGGGGGAGAAGSNAAGANTGGDGGNGLPYSISGYSTYYAGGGGGGSEPTQANRSGGLGGGGYGDGQDTNGGTGVPYTGGGGGGTRSSNVFLIGGTGGSGIVIVRYLT